MSCRECFYITGHGDECSIGSVELKADLGAALSSQQEWEHRALEAETEVARLRELLAEVCVLASGRVEWPADVSLRLSAALATTSDLPEGKKP